MGTSARTRLPYCAAHFFRVHSSAGTDNGALLSATRSTRFSAPPGRSFSLDGISSAACGATYADKNGACPDSPCDEHAA